MIQKISDEEFSELVRVSRSINEICLCYPGYSSGGTVNRTKKRIQRLGIDITHFDGGRSKRFQRKTVSKPCLRCGTYFDTKLGASREKKYCSKVCANRNGNHHPTERAIKIRETWQKKWITKECLFCKNIFRVPPHEHHRKYCSNRCGKKSQWSDPEYRRMMTIKFKAAYASG